MRGFARTGSFPLVEKAIKEQGKISRVLQQGVTLILTLLPSPIPVSSFQFWKMELKMWVLLSSWTVYTDKNLFITYAEKRLKIHSWAWNVDFFFVQEMVPHGLALDLMLHLWEMAVGSITKERALQQGSRRCQLWHFGLCALRLNHIAEQGVVSVTTAAMCSGTWIIASLLPAHCNEYTEVSTQSLIYLRDFQLQEQDHLSCLLPQRQRQVPAATSHTEE